MGLKSEEIKAIEDRVRKSINNAMDCLNSATRSKNDIAINSHLVSAVTHLELAIAAIQVRIEDQGGDRCFLE